LPLDRQSIEKRDFPIGRRGYEPSAVDAHLAALAGEIETLQRSSSAQPRRGGDSLASAASEQVRTIVEAAEQSAVEIERQARGDAERITDDAQREAERLRSDAVERASEHVSKVSSATALMLQRVDAMEGELTALIENLRTGANRLSADLSLLEGNMGELYGAAAGQEPALTDAEPAIIEDEGADVSLGAETVEATSPSPVPETVLSDRPDLEELAEPEPEPVPADEGGSADAEGARLIALNMALNGQSREETDRYLAENFDLADRDRLLDEVYASVEG
jgi:hypothetical protein